MDEDRTLHSLDFGFLSWFFHKKLFPKFELLNSGCGLSASLYGMTRNFCLMFLVLQYVSEITRKTLQNLFFRICLKKCPPFRAAKLKCDVCLLRRLVCNRKQDGRKQGGFKDEEDSVWPERQTRKAARIQVTYPASQCICFSLSQNVGLSGFVQRHRIDLASRSTIVFGPFRAQLF